MQHNLHSNTSIKQLFTQRSLGGKKAARFRIPVLHTHTHTHTHKQSQDLSKIGWLAGPITRQKNWILNAALNYLAAIFLCFSDHVLSWVNPIELLVQWVIVNGPDIPKAVDRKDDVGALLFINHHAVDGTLLTEEQESSWSLKKEKSKEEKHSYPKSCITQRFDQPVVCISYKTDMYVEKVRLRQNPLECLQKLS